MKFYEEVSISNHICIIHELCKIKVIHIIKFDEVIFQATKSSLFELMIKLGRNIIRPICVQIQERGIYIMYMYSTVE